MLHEAIVFETNELSKVYNPFSTPENEEYLWTHVSLRLHIPWFYIIYNIELEEGGMRNMLLVTSIDDLIEINKDTKINVEHIYLVSPEHMNKSKRWMMDPIKEILSGLDPEHEQSSYVYVLENGKRYVYSFMSSSEEELRNIKTIYTNA